MKNSSVVARRTTKPLRALQSPAPSTATLRTLAVRHQEMPVNKRKKVALRKHRIKRKKMEEKRRLSGLARRK